MIGLTLDEVAFSEDMMEGKQREGRLKGMVQRSKHEAERGKEFVMGEKGEQV